MAGNLIYINYYYVCDEINSPCEPLFITYFIFGIQTFNSKLKQFDYSGRIESNHVIAGIL